MIQGWGVEKRLELFKPVERTADEQAVVWATQLPKNVKEKFGPAVRYLKDVKLRVAYQKPPSLRALLFKPKALEKKAIGQSSTCGKCRLCGNHGKGWTNMVHQGSEFFANGRSHSLKQDLNCSSRGIYVAMCTTCPATYTGQTCTSFSKRLSGHRLHWSHDGKKSSSDKKTDDTALLEHYREHHPVELQRLSANTKTRGFDKAFQVVFVDSTSGSLDVREDFWKQKLKSSINRCNIVTPSILH